MENQNLFEKKRLLQLHAVTPNEARDEVQTYKGSLEKQIFQERKVSLHHLLVHNRNMTSFFLYLPEECELQPDSIKVV